jgi:hypothetical protein
MDRDEQVSVQMVSAPRTLEQTSQPRAARNQSNCFVEPCLVQRLGNNIGELEVEFVFGYAAGAVGARRSGRWPTSMSTRNSDRAQLPLSLECCVAESSARTSFEAEPARITAIATIRRSATLLKTMIVPVLQLRGQTDALWKHPAHLYLFLCHRTNKY